MNKLVTFVALGLIIGGFLLVTFSYAAPTGNNGSPYVPELPDNKKLPDPPNDYVPPYQQEDENIPYHEEVQPPTTPPPNVPGETYVTKYLAQNQIINVTYNAGEKRYEGRINVQVAYPVAHHHETHVVVTVSNGMSMSVYRNNGLTEQYGPTTGYHDFLGQSSSVETVTWGFFIYGSSSRGYATVTLYVTEWPSSKLSIFGTGTNDMTIGVIMLIAGFAALLLFRKH